MYKRRTCILTGATGGGGYEIAHKIYGAGMNMILVGTSDEKLEKLSKELERKDGKGAIDHVVSNFTEPGEVQEAAQQIIQKTGKGIDVLINNAGVGYHCPVERIKQDDLIATMQINTIAPILLCSILLPHLKRSDDSQIINISSVLGSKGVPNTSTYTASKHALNGFTDVLRKEIDNHGPRVTQIEPGAIETPFTERITDHETARELRSRKMHKIPPSEIALWVMKILESDTSVRPEVVRLMPKDQII